MVSVAPYFCCLCPEDRENMKIMGDIGDMDGIEEETWEIVETEKAWESRKR